MKHAVTILLCFLIPVSAVADVCYPVPLRTYRGVKKDPVVFLKERYITFFQYFPPVQTIGPGAQNSPPTNPDLPPIAVYSEPLTSKTDQALQALKTNCINCHGNGATKGGLSLFDSSGNLRITSTRTKDINQKIKERILDGTMPPDKQLSPQEKISLTSLF